MSEQSPYNPDAIQFMQLSPEQAEMIKTNRDAIYDIGHVAMEGVELIGIVVGGEEQLYYLSMDEHDPGTRISVEPGRTPNAADNLAKYGNPEEQLAKLFAETHEAEKHDDDTEPPLEALLRDSPLHELTERYTAIESMVYETVTQERYATDNLVQELQAVLGMLRNVADTGSYNKIADQHHIKMKMEMLSQEVQSRFNLKMRSAEESEGSVRTFASQFGEASEDTDRILRDSANDESQVVRNTTNMITDELGSFTRILGSSNEFAVDTLRILTQSLDNAVYDYHMTVDDVMPQLYQLQQRLIETGTDNLRVQTMNESVSHGISALKQLLQK